MFNRLLIKLSRLAKTDLLYLSRGASWSLVDHFFSSAALLVSSVIFANFLPKETYGSYSFIVSWLTIFSTLAVSGIGEAMLRGVARGNEGDLQWAFNYRLRWGLLASLVSLGFAGYYYFQNNFTFALSFLIVAVFMPLLLASELVPRFFFAKELFKETAIFNTISKTFSLVALLAMLLLTDSLPALMIVYFIPPVIISYLYLALVVKRYQKNNQVSADMKNFALHLTLMQVVGSVSKRIDQLLLFSFVGPAELATYKFALMPSEQLHTFLAIINRLGISRFARRPYQEIYPALGRKMIAYTAVIAIMVVASIIIVPYIYPILFPLYFDSIPYAIILLLPSLLAASALFNTLLFAKRELKYLYLLKIWTHGLRFLAFFLLISNFGVGGAVAAEVTVAVIVALTVFGLFFKERNKWREF